MRLFERMRRTHGPVWAAASLVLFAVLLGSSSAHDHADDPPGAEIHCVAVAGPAVVGPVALDVVLQQASPTALEEVEAVAPLRSVSVVFTDRARAPPVGTASYS